MKKIINATITPNQLKKLKNIAKIAKNSCETRPYLQYMKFEKVTEIDCDGAFIKKLEISATDGFILASIKVKADFENFDEPVYFDCGSFTTINNDHDKKGDMNLIIESSPITDDAWSRTVKGQFGGTCKPHELKVGDPDSMPDLARHLITPKPNFRFAISAKKLKQALECVQSDDKLQSIIFEGNTQDKRAVRVSHKAGEATALVCLLNL
jgi:DNA polymerase III sliding clamp (beta) subunit (PCNA family)